MIAHRRPVIAVFDYPDLFEDFWPRFGCGTPVFASRVGGVGELIIEGETGGLCEPGDDAAIARKLDAALADPGRLAAMRPLARIAAETRLAPAVVARALRECFVESHRNRGKSTVLAGTAGN